MFFEKLGEVIGIVYTAMLGDGLYLKLGGAKKFTCSVHAPRGYIIGNVFSGFFMKQRAQITCIQTLQGCERMQAQVAG